MKKKLNPKPNQTKPKTTINILIQFLAKFEEHPKNLNAQYLIADNHILCCDMEVDKYQTLSCTTVQKMERENQRIMNLVKGRPRQNFIFINSSFFAE